MQNPIRNEPSRSISSRRLRAGFRSQEGNSLVELAMVLPLFVIMLFGVLEFGRLMYAAIEVANAANAGALYAAQNLVAASNTSAIQTAASNDGSDLIAWNQNGVTATATTTCKCSNGTATTCAAAASTCVSPAHPEEFVQVKTQSVIDPLFYLPGLPHSYTLKGQAMVRVQ